MSQAYSEADPLVALAEEFADRYRRGERPSPTEYAARHPELAERIRRLFPAMVAMEEIASDAGRPPPGGPTAPGAAHPRQLGEYRIVGEISRGGMGIVYEALQESLGRHVALKVIPTQRLTPETQLERFRREAQAAARLHHTNIVPVFGVGERDGVHYYAMQFTRGHSLDSLQHELRRLRDRNGSAPIDDDSRGPDLSLTLAQELVTGLFSGGEPNGPDRDDAEAVPIRLGAGASRRG